MTKAARTDTNVEWVEAAAGQCFPVSELNEANRAALSKSATLVPLQRTDVLSVENSHRWLIYLLEGTLTLYKGRDEVGTLKADTPQAKRPLFTDKSAYQTARASGTAKVVRFGREQLDILLKEQQRNALTVLDVHVDALDNLIFDDVAAGIANGDIAMHIAPASARQVIAMSQRITGIPEMAEIIQCDAGLAMHVMNMANRADPAAGEATSSMRGAITRLGVKETQRVVLALLQKYTLTPKSEFIAVAMRQYAQRTSLCASAAQVMAHEIPHLKPEVASLVAVSADIGELLVLSYANRHAERFADTAQLAGVIEKLRVILSCWLITVWGYPSEFSSACYKARDWYRTHNGDITYTDLVTAALLMVQAKMPDVQHSSIPAADNLLLARRLQQSGIDLSRPDVIINAAKNRLVQVHSQLKAS